jgi:hypothetical protein
MHIQNRPRGLHGYFDTIIADIRTGEDLLNRGIHDVQAAGGADQIQTSPYVPTQSNAMLIIGGLLLLYFMSKR